MSTYTYDTLMNFGTSLLTAKGLPEVDAEYITEHAVRTEAMGVPTHGLKALNAVAAMVPKVVAADTKPEIIKEKGSTLLIDANSGLSQLGMKIAVEKGIEKAHANGVSHISIRNARWIGALAPYVMDIAKENLFVQAWAHASQCKDCAPIGGLDGKFSTNPIAVAFPTDSVPMIADMSTAMISMGKKGQLQGAGQETPDYAFMDKEGTLSKDPHTFDEGGTLLFTGGAHYGHKGYALSLWCEAMTAMAGGYANDPDKEQRQSIHLTIIDPEAFEGMEYYNTEITRFIAHIKDNRLREGYDAIRFPGERAQAALAANMKNGIPVEDGLVENLNKHAADAGVASL